MSITPSQRAIVQSTFARVADPVAFAALFYERLFEIAQEVKPLFKSSLTEQGKKLMKTLGVVVHGLDELEMIVPAIQALGKRHVAYGVKAEHYDIVGSAILWTIEQAFGDDFTDEIKDAWTAAYGLVAQTAIAAAEEASAASGD